MTRETIRIAGGGIAGLASAIRLAKAGRSVEIYERRPAIGGRFLGDLQGLENWTTEQDVLDELLELGIEPTFRAEPLPPLIATDGTVTLRPRLQRPLCYLVKRGSDTDSLDSALRDQAQAVGVALRLGEALPPERAHIWAAGPESRQVFAIAKGLAFETSMEDVAIGLVNEGAAAAGYAYLLVRDGYGCLCTALFDHFERVGECFDETQRIVSRLVDLQMDNPRRVGGLGSFSARPRLTRGEALVVGEAAGLQDLLWGFGIRTAIQSGALASRALLEGRDYRRLVREQLQGKLWASVVNRFLYGHAGRLFGYRTLLRLAIEGANPAGFLRSAYRFTRVHRALYPLVEQFEERRLRRLNRGRSVDWGTG